MDIVVDDSRPEFGLKPRQPLPEDFDETWTHPLEAQATFRLEYLADGDDRPVWAQDLGDYDPEFDFDRTHDQPCWHCLKGERVQDDACTDCWDLLYLCSRCRWDFKYEGSLCRTCRDTVMCSICGAKQRVSGHRCDTCRKYFARNGRERPVRLAARQRDLNLRRSERPDELTMSVEEYRRTVETRRRQHLASLDNPLI